MQLHATSVKNVNPLQSSSYIYEMSGQNMKPLHSKSKSSGSERRLSNDFLKAVLIDVTTINDT